MRKSVPLSVCMPVYNPGEYLSQAIASILKQDFTDFELIIVDDASTEPIDAIVAEFADPRIRFVRNPHNLGLTRNWNRCLELGNGKYVTIFHQDDVMLPNSLAKRSAMLDKNPQVGLVYSDIVRIDEHNQIIGGHYIPQPTEDRVTDGAVLYEMVAQTGNPIACQTVMVRQECYQKLGGFDPRIHFAVDLEMWMRIALHYRIGFLCQPTVQTRVHNKQETFRFQYSGNDYADIFRTYQIIYHRPLPPPYERPATQTFRTLAGQSLGMAKWLTQQGKIAKAARYLWIWLRSQQEALR